MDKTLSSYIYIIQWRKECEFRQGCASGVPNLPSSAAYL